MKLFYEVSFFKSYIEIFKIYVISVMYTVICFVEIIFFRNNAIIIIQLNYITQSNIEITCNNIR